MRRFNFAELPIPAVRWVVIQGDKDELVDIDSVLAWVHTAAPPPGVVVVEGAGHFFHGKLNELRTAVLENLRS